MSDPEHRRFQINREPLRTRGEVPEEDPNAGRCEWISTRTGWRCTRQGVEEVDGRCYCRQHAAMAKRRAGR